MERYNTAIEESIANTVNTEHISCCQRDVTYNLSKAILIPIASRLKLVYDVSNISFTFLNKLTL